MARTGSARQGETALGVEWLVVGTAEWTAGLVIMRSGARALADRPIRERVIRIAGVQLATVPAIVAGALLVTGLGQAFYWQAAGVSACLVVGSRTRGSSSSRSSARTTAPSPVARYASSRRG